MNIDPENEVPQFAFIRKLLPDATEHELRDADHAFFAYVELVKSVCDELATENSSSTSSDSEKKETCDRVLDNKQ